MMGGSAALGEAEGKLRKKKRSSGGDTSLSKMHRKPHGGMLGSSGFQRVRQAFKILRKI